MARAIFIKSSLTLEAYLEHDRSFFPAIIYEDCHSREQHLVLQLVVDSVGHYRSMPFQTLIFANAKMEL